MGGGIIIYGRGALGGRAAGPALVSRQTITGWDGVDIRTAGQLTEQVSLSTNRLGCSDRRIGDCSDGEGSHHDLPRRELVNRSSGNAGRIRGSHDDRRAYLSAQLNAADVLRGLLDEICSRCQPFKSVGTTGIRRCELNG